MNSDLIFVESVPQRGPFKPLDELSGFFRNRKIYDLGCGSGDMAVHIKHKFNPISIKGISFKKERFVKQKERYKMNFSCGDINQIDFAKEDIDTYFIWIENPSIEMRVVERNINADKHPVIIIAYNSKVNCRFKENLIGNFNPNCAFCKYIGCINYKMSQLRSFLKKNKVVFIEKEIGYDEGEKCRQKGFFNYFIIQL